MAASDARPVPRKNAAYRLTFTILDADGDPVSGAAGLDSEVSIDGGTFADCTNEATEIATASGMYFIDLTAAEMNGDTIAYQCKTSTTGAKTTQIVMCPEESGDIRVNVTQVNSSATSASNLQLSTAAMITGTVDTGGGFTPTTTQFESSLTEATADHYKGRIVVFTSGALIAQVARITAYSLVSGRGRITVETMTEAPANSDAFLLV